SAKDWRKASATSRFDWAIRIAGNSKRKVRAYRIVHRYLPKVRNLQEKRNRGRMLDYGNLYRWGCDHRTAIVFHTLTHGGMTRANTITTATIHARVWLFQ